jgi:RNA polymerase subunit RPABC4/transcription elongation factor Spt4
MNNELKDNFKAIPDCSPEEIRQYRERFAADLKQYRATEKRYALPVLLVFLAGFSALIYSYVLSPHPIKWLLATGIVLIIAGFVSLVATAFLLQSRLKCPACHFSFLSDIANHCPECGSASLESGDWLGAKHCNACGKSLRTGKNRNFRHKACTNCGVFLDDKGL